MQLETKLIDICKYIDSYFTIKKEDDKYLVFTFATQHFTIEKITDLTPELFEKMIEKQNKHIEKENYYFNKLHEVR